MRTNQENISAVSDAGNDIEPEMRMALELAWSADEASEAVCRRQLKRQMGAGSTMGAGPSPEEAERIRLKLVVRERETPAMLEAAQAYYQEMTETEQAARCHVAGCVAR